MKIPMSLFMNFSASHPAKPPMTMAANQPIPAAGSVMEVRYLYVYAGGALFQPVLLNLGAREDVAFDGGPSGFRRSGAASGVIDFQLPDSEVDPK